MEVLCHSCLILSGSSFQGATEIATIEGEYEIGSSLCGGTFQDQGLILKTERICIR